MRIPGLGNLKNIASSPKMMEKAAGMLKKVGIKKSVNVIKAEYNDFCDRGSPSAKDKTGFLSVMDWLADTDAKKWIDQERTKLDKIIEAEENEKNN